MGNVVISRVWGHSLDGLISHHSECRWEVCAVLSGMAAAGDSGSFIHTK